DRVEIDAPRLVADARRLDHFRDRIGALDPLHRRLAQELVIIIAAARPLRLENIPLDWGVRPHRRQGPAGRSAVAPAAAVALEAVAFDMEQHYFTSVGKDLGAVENFAVAVADGDDAHTIVTNDHFARTVAAKLLIVDIAGAAPQPFAAVA